MSYLCPRFIPSFCRLRARRNDSANRRPEKIKAVTTVGAGDTFNGAFLAALREANQVAAKAVASKQGVLGAPQRR